MSRIMIFGCVLVLLTAPTAATAQRATEVFIPIGKSPGLSGEHTRIATIVSFDAEAQTITVTESSQTYTVHCSRRTWIWLDRSKLGRSNGSGAITDCHSGRAVEVKYENNNRSAGVAEWVKVEIVDSN